jgi:hypothetical protein
MSGLEKMNRLTFHLDKVLRLYKTHSHGAVELPEVQRALSRIDGLLSHRQDWKDDLESMKTWMFQDL